MQNKYLKQGLKCLGLFLLLGLYSACVSPAENAESRQANYESKIDALLGQMTLEEKIGQMTQIEKGSLRSGDVQKYYLGSVLSGGGGAPQYNMPETWVDMVNSFQKEALSTRLAIPILYGIDAVHGNNNLLNATIFPHNLALGATDDAELVRKIGEFTALETAAAGISWTFAPCLAVAQDPRWGRTYESFGLDTSLVTSLGSAFIEGYQEAITGTGLKNIACAKHFIGDGATLWGSSGNPDSPIDQGNTIADETFLRTVLLPPYEAAIKSGVRSIMVSYSSWQGVKMHGNKDLVTDLLKGELGFTGLVVSDWAAIDQVSKDYYTAVVQSINAGIDMCMVPQNAPKFINAMKKAVENNDISLERIDDAVRRILRVKFECGLFDAPFASTPELIQAIRSPEHLALAREAVAKSQVILKNEGLLPLKKDLKKLYVAGYAADDIGVQCGGWTISWQGRSGDTTEGSTILEALEEKLPEAELEFDEFGEFDDYEEDAICVVVLGELPYAEGRGDNAELILDSDNQEILDNASKRFKNLVLILLSGRPLILGDNLSVSKAFVAAWLPGTEGGGVADVLFGDVKPSGKLPFPWPKSLDQLPFGNFTSGQEEALFPLGYGLSY